MAEPCSENAEQLPGKSGTKVDSTRAAYKRGRPKITWGRSVEAELKNVGLTWRKPVNRQRTGRNVNPLWMAHVPPRHQREREIFKIERFVPRLKSSRDSTLLTKSGRSRLNQKG